MFAIMQRCWEVEVADRPTFEALYKDIRKLGRVCRLGRAQRGVGPAPHRGSSGVSSAQREQWAQQRTEGAVELQSTSSDAMPRALALTLCDSPPWCLGM